MGTHSLDVFLSIEPANRHHPGVSLWMDPNPGKHQEHPALISPINFVRSSGPRKESPRSLTSIR